MGKFGRISESMGRISVEDALQRMLIEGCCEGLRWIIVVLVGNRRLIGGFGRFLYPV